MLGFAFEIHSLNFLIMFPCYTEDKCISLAFEHLFKLAFQLFLILGTFACCHVLIDFPHTHAHTYTSSIIYCKTGRNLKRKLFDAPIMFAFNWWCSNGKASVTPQLTIIKITLMYFCAPIVFVFVCFMSLFFHNLKSNPKLIGIAYCRVCCCFWQSFVIDWGTILQLKCNKRHQLVILTIYNF